MFHHHVLPPPGKTMQPDDMFFCGLTVELKGCACEPTVVFYMWILVSADETWYFVSSVNIYMWINSL
jgi:hypothetical protein